MCIRDREYALGLKNLFKSQFTYHKISGIISDDFPISPIGFMKYKLWGGKVFGNVPFLLSNICLLYTSDAADERSSVDLGGRRIIKKKNRSYQSGSALTARNYLHRPHWMNR